MTVDTPSDERWREHMSPDERAQMGVRWHAAGRPGGMAYVQWLVDAGYLVPASQLRAERDRHAKTLRFNAEQSRRALDGQRQSLSRRAAENVAAFNRVHTLMTDTAGRKTVGREALRRALYGDTS